MSVPRSTGRLAGLVLVCLAALFAVTATATAWYYGERAARARAHISDGHAHAARGQLQQALEEYRAALLLERSSVEAERALALTLLQLDRVSEADAYLTDLLQRDPVNGRLNLAMARIRSARASDEARRLYERAIYGEWPEGDSGRVNARFELAEHLSAHGGRDEVLAELLQLKADLEPDDISQQRRLASLLLRAEAPEAAVEVLQTAVKGEPDDVILLAELGDAQARAGRSTEARRTYRRVLSLAPDRQDVGERLAVLERVLALDPTLPNLRITTRTRRARQLLEAVVEQTPTCESAPDAGPLRGDAQTRLASRAAATPEAAEAELALALRLWAAAVGCRNSGPEADAVTQVLGRVEMAREDPQP